jgi:hypothetical protein
VKAAPFNPHAHQPSTFALPPRNVLHFDPTERLPALLVKDTTPTKFEPIVRAPSKQLLSDAVKLLRHL